MKSLGQSLNLRPQEMRLVVFVLALLFALLNMWLVWPHFKDWRRYQVDLEKARRTLAQYQAEIAKGTNYLQQLQEFEGASAVIPEESHAVNLSQTVMAQAMQKQVRFSGVNMRTSTAAKTNAFFDEAIVDFGLNPTGPNELVNYLLALGAEDSMIRVQEMTLRPDQTKSKLMGRLVLVASYQKKPAAPPPSTTPPAPRAKASVVTTNKPDLRKKP
ncbi:MAG TPA: hypothetical protein P5186_17275 [Candidatus Paceibacterota bacterium]|nr:hypothetical protein [Verrucomicrobiota bacterium]HRY49803.1 hypothetical protein [Candidatus Paceibacterota bacterium]